MTVSDLIDYLQQFQSETLVILSEADAKALPDSARYIALDVLDYTPSEKGGNL
jgi:hypothetical protein